MIRRLHVNEQNAIPCGGQLMFMSTNEIRSANFFFWLFCETNAHKKGLEYVYIYFSQVYV